ncbi:MAG: CDP-alcohol phosphatidyltransferase family protein [Firmicutes bacterium]|nr:CDP-alcohol phosphatidyltransferase family protein [Bacillota bacterium]
MAWKLLLINALTLIRVIGTIILIPIYKSYGGLYVSILALICYLTDSIDGILARRWKVSTFFGALFDGAADKLFTIINFVVLYLITPHALIPIIFEIAIIVVLFFKFIMKLNVKSNIIGKLKVWILAMSVVLTFLVSDIKSIAFVPLKFKEWLLNISSSTLYFWLLLPTILIEFLTFSSYVLELFAPKKIKILNTPDKVLKIPELKGKSIWGKFKCIWLNPEFYNEHKNDTNLKALWKLSIR